MNVAFQAPSEYATTELFSHAMNKSPINSRIREYWVLIPVRPLTQTLIESAIRDGQSGLASNLMNERSVLKPFSPLIQRFKGKIA